MTEPFIGEVQIFGFNFAPKDWAYCNGATLNVTQNTALYSLIGANYGGNGTTTFQLPNLTNRTACSQGNGPGLTPRVIGEDFGSNEVTLTISELPQHNHRFNAFLGGTGPGATPTQGAGLTSPRNPQLFVNNVSPNTSFSPMMIGVTGGNQPHPNIQPVLALNYSIALYGVFPSFS